MDRTVSAGDSTSLWDIFTVLNRTPDIWAELRELRGSAALTVTGAFVPWTGDLAGFGTLVRAPLLAHGMNKSGKCH